jgi:hypothetical protein
MKRIQIALILILIISCQGNLNLLPSQDALIIGYDSRKCYCLYGWKIKVNNDTILTSSPIVGMVVGYDIEQPVPVQIEVKAKDSSCKYPYYDVISISKNNK